MTRPVSFCLQTIIPNSEQHRADLFDRPMEGLDLAVNTLSATLHRELVRLNSKLPLHAHSTASDGRMTAQAVAPQPVSHTGLRRVSAVRHWLSDKASKSAEGTEAGGSLGTDNGGEPRRTYRWRRPLSRRNAGSCAAQVRMTLIAAVKQAVHLSQHWGTVHVCRALL